MDASCQTGRGHGCKGMTVCIAEGASPRWAFIHIGPGNLWVRTHVAAALVACPFCKAARGELCQNKGRMVSTTHWTRRGVLSGRCDAKGRMLVPTRMSPARGEARVAKTRKCP